MRHGRAWRARAATVACVLLLSAACGESAQQGVDPAAGPTTDPAAVDRTPADPEAAPSAPDDKATPTTPVADPEHAVEPPGPREGALQVADMIVYSQQSLSDEMVTAIREMDGVTALEQISMSQVAIENRVINVAAVDPATYRNYAPVNSAELEDIWTRVAGGELAIEPGLGKKLQDDEGNLKLGNDEDAPVAHIGAYAPQVPQIDAVVNETWAEDLGMRPGNALLIHTGITAPQAVRKPIEEIVGDDSSVQSLDAVARFGLDPKATQTAFLTGGSVAEAVGTFGYRVLGGGRIAPDQSWVTANIRTETVPILGNVTCHRVVMPQLRAALIEIQTRGLADEINPGEYAGCYYPRFIANSTQLSLHSFGIALDLNTPGNQRGTVGEMDRTVVSIFKKWGFAWGGDWNYTDPMHFEMDRIVDAR